MIARSLQFISAAVLLTTNALAQASALQPGTVHRLSFHDVDGNDFSTAEGRVTIVTVVTRETEDKAHAVADQVPPKCIGDPKYRYVTLVNFQRKLPGPLQGMTRGIIRRRLDTEAQGLKKDYEAKKLTRDPRKDLYVVADFDGTAVTQLGVVPESNNISVFIFDGKGKLVQRWGDVPSAGAVAKAIAEAE